MLQVRQGGPTHAGPPGAGLLTSVLHSKQLVNLLDIHDNTSLSLNAAAATMRNGG